MTGSTHLKANANKNRFDKAVVAKSRADYWEALDAVIEADRAAHGKKPLKAKPRKPVEKETKISRTDPAAGYMVRDGKPKGFFYLDHRTVDGRLGIITDSFATPANVHDTIVYLGRLDRTRRRFDLDVRAVGLDAGYATAGIAKGLEERDILGVIGYRNPTPPKPGMMRKKAFVYDPALDRISFWWKQLVLPPKAVNPIDSKEIDQFYILCRHRNTIPTKDELI